MRGHKAAPLIPPILAALAIAALTLYAYRELPARPFAADDYQWLLNVRGLSIGEVARKAFDPGAQSHFYRPLVWLLFWAQTRAFGLDPRGFHAVSLALHLLNAFLLGWLFYRLTGDEGRRARDETRYPWSFVFRLSSALVASAIVALHPAPFEAVVWVSSQSELLAAALLLAALLLWTTDDPSTSSGQAGRRTTGDGFRHSIVYRLSSIVGGWPVLLVTLALGLALLAKESAVIGLPLLILLSREPGPGALWANQEPIDTQQESGVRSQGHASSIKSQPSAITHHASRITYHASRIAPYLLPTLITLGYVALQIMIERRNYLLAQGGYGIGPQLVLNPLRSLALIVAPLPGSEHADAAWLAPVGALVAIGLIGFTIYDLRFTIGDRLDRSSVVGRRSSVGLILALGLTLLPTAPFISPPDSRYLYLPVMAAALLVACLLDQRPMTNDQKLSIRSLGRWSFVLGLLFALALAWWASGELHAREGRFAAASGPGGSLWRVASAVCAARRPERMVIVDPPLAPPHAEAIVGLACGDETRAKIVGRDQIAKAIKGHTVVIAFPNGSAEIEQRT